MVQWQKHLDKIGTPLKTAIESINTQLLTELDYDVTNLWHYLTDAQIADAQAFTYSLDMSTEFQSFVDYIGALGVDGEIPYGGYRLDTPIDIEGTVCLSLTGKAFRGFTGVVPRGAVIAVNNSTAAFVSATDIYRLRLQNLVFTAMGVGNVGVAYAVKQTGPLTNYAQRCEFTDIDLWRTMGGGWYGNWILTTWKGGEWGYFGTPGAKFNPIYSFGEVGGNQTNCNRIENVYVRYGKGTDCLFFEAGTDLNIDGVKFEGLISTRALRCLGISVTNVIGCYFESASGSTNVVEFANDTTDAMGCNVINFQGNTIGMGGATNFINAGGASGFVVFDANRVTASVGGKNVLNHTLGVNKGFSSYQGNSLLNVTGPAYDNIFTLSGTWTPALRGSTGTSVHTYDTDATKGTYYRTSNIVTAWFRILLTAKDAGMTGNAYVDMTGLPTVKAQTGFNGITSALYKWANVTLAAGQTQLGIAAPGAGGVPALLWGSGSGIAGAAQLSAGIANTTELEGVLVYETSDA